MWCVSLVFLFFVSGLFQSFLVSYKIFPVFRNLYRFYPLLKGTCKSRYWLSLPELFLSAVDLRGVDFPPFILLILFWKRKDIIKSFLAKLFVLSLYTVKLCNSNIIIFFLREKVFGRIWIKQVYITFLGTHFN